MLNIPLPILTSVRFCVCFDLVTPNQNIWVLIGIHIVKSLFSIVRVDVKMQVVPTANVQGGLQRYHI